MRTISTLNKAVYSLLNLTAIKIHLYHNHTHRLRPNPIAAGAYAPDAHPVGLRGGQAFQQDMGAGGGGEDMLPVGFDRGVALGGLHVVAACAG